MSELKKSIYLDNNATTKACNETKKEMMKWIQACSNPSGSSYISKKSAKLIDDSINYIKTHNNAKKYKIIFTSGASESNCTIIRSVVESFRKHAKENETGVLPHIISSSYEHKSVLECLNSLHDCGDITLTLIKPNIRGLIDPRSVERAITKETCLITIMFANNEIGSINPIEEIGRIAHEYNVPLHTDAVQIYGKYKINIPKFNIDALSASFHKLHGPPGVGLLIISNDLINGYKLECQIAGTQQNGLRGGTENVPGIAGSIAGMQYTFKNRKLKNKQLSIYKKEFIKHIIKEFKLIDYKAVISDTIPKEEQKGINLVVLGSSQLERMLPSTILLSVINWDKKFCNVKLKKFLESKKVIVSIGSACNTKSKKASHVLDSINANPIIKRGILRISFSDDNNKKEVIKAAKILIDAIKSQ